MSRSKKWRLEWSFFIGENGRRQYNAVCRKCIHGCKQSFRAILITCLRYLFVRSKKRGDKGSKMSEYDAISDFYDMGSRISFVVISAVCTVAKTE